MKTIPDLRGTKSILEAVEGMNLEKLIRYLDNDEISESDFWAMLRLSQWEFARLIGVSAGYVNRLAAMGVVVLNPQKHVLPLESFRRFVDWYFPPWRFSELIDGAVTGVTTSRRPRRQSSILFNCRDLREEILAAELVRLRAEITLRFVDGLPLELMATFNRIKARIRRLRERQRRARRELSNFLTAASLPPKVQIVMERRFVDCATVAEIAAEMGLSTRQIFRLQRRGLEMLGYNQIN